MKILVVDDERAIRSSLVELLERDGHEVREAEHDVAIAVLANGPADFAEDAVGAIAEPFLSGR